MLRALDLFCGAGGATRGLQRAGFHVTGVDINPQPRYCGNTFHQADALTYPLDGFHFIWASPPCQAYSALKSCTNQHAKLIGPVRRRLRAASIPYAIENVPGAPLINPVLLCGAAFNLSAICDDGLIRWLKRHRLIETSTVITSLDCRCQPGEKLGVYGREQRRPNRLGRFGAPKPVPWHCSHGGYQGSARERKEVMGTPWMTMREAAQAVPPSYAEFIVKQIFRQLACEAGG